MISSWIRNAIQLFIDMPKARVISPFRGQHDHDHCQVSAIETAEAECARKGLKLTELRRQVLEIIWSSHNPIGAYDILQQLQSKGHKPAPPTAYRALDFLVSAKLVHRLESMNAFIGCPSPEASHQCQFYICQQCGHTAELHSEAVAQAIESGAEQLGFIHNEPVIEVHGTCKACSKKEPS